jgi:hypothetical protein
MRGPVENANNPHVFGIDACEVFILDDQVVLVEGQEDVVVYRRIAEQLKREMPREFFGWGGAKRAIWDSSRRCSPNLDSLRSPASSDKE